MGLYFLERQYGGGVVASDGNHLILGFRFQKLIIGGHLASNLQFLSSGLLACGDPLESIWTCQNWRTQKWPLFQEPVSLASIVTSESSCFGKSIWIPNEPPTKTYKCLASITSGLTNIKDLSWPQNWALYFVYLSLEVKTLMSAPKCCNIYLVSKAFF